MRTYFIMLTFFLSLLYTGCKKDIKRTEEPFEEILNQPYTSGIIKFQFEVERQILGKKYIVDTVVSFSSTGKNPTENYLYGLYQPSIRWTQLLRIHPDNFSNHGGIYFVGTNLDSLTYPFTFRKGDFINAQFNYLLKYFFVPDSSAGTAGYYPDVYAATTYSDNFELTILKRINNRLQGVFKGTVKKMDGSTLDIKKGVFDVEIEER